MECDSITDQNSFCISAELTKITKRTIQRVWNLLLKSFLLRSIRLIWVNTRIFLIIKKFFDHPCLSWNNLSSSLISAFKHSMCLTLFFSSQNMLMLCIIYYTSLEMKERLEFYGKKRANEYGTCITMAQMIQNRTMTSRYIKIRHIGKHTFYQKIWFFFISFNHYINISGSLRNQIITSTQIMTHFRQVNDSFYSNLTIKSIDIMSGYNPCIKYNTQKSNNTKDVSAFYSYDAFRYVT